MALVRNRGLPYAAPSWVMPGTIAENAVFLAGKVGEIGLCLFEAEACLAYNENDLPQTLAALDLSWHIHLPVDLPWDNAADAAQICLALWRKTFFLSPRYAVLHPPQSENPASLLEKFARYWQKRSSLPVLLENVDYCDVFCLGADFLRKNSFGFCLDVGHALAFNQRALLASHLPEQARLWHWSAPGGRDRHLPLGCLGEKEKAVARPLAGRMDANAVCMFEIFDWNGVLKSIAVFERMISGE